MPIIASACAGGSCRACGELSLDSVERSGDAALEQRPVEAERERKVTAPDHGVGLLCGARHAADRHTTLQDTFLRTLHQRDDLGIIGLAMLADGSSEIA